MFEKLTPTKFSAVKKVEGSKDGRDYSFFSVGFLTREHGDKKWYNLAFNKDNPLKEGETYELEIKERTYKDKEGNDKVSYNAKLPSKDAEMSRIVFAMGVRLGKLEERVKALEVKNGPTQTGGGVGHSAVYSPAQLDSPPDEVLNDLPF